MSRTLDTVHTRLTVRSDPQQPGAHGPERLDGRRRVAIGVAVLLVLAVVTSIGWLALRRAGSRVEAVDYATAVALEAGVRPLVSDRVGELGTVTEVTVKRTPDPTTARVHLLAPVGEQRPRLSVLTDPEPADPVIDGWLADGRPYEISQAEGRYVSLFTVGLDDQYVSVIGREISFDDLLVLAADVAIGTSSLDRVPDGWVELGAAPMPPWHHGFGTYYDFEGGRRLAVNVERATPGREALAAFGDTEPVDLGTDGWAFRYRPPNSGLLFERGDVVVDLKGDFSEAELLIVTHSLREMLPSEHPISEPDDRE